MARARAGGHAGGELRHLRPGVRAAGARAREPGGEEYLDSEKYELRRWDLARADSLAAFIGRVNRIRRDNPALQADDALRFLPVDNDQLIAYAKHTPTRDNVIVVRGQPRPAPRAERLGRARPRRARPRAATQPFQVHDLLTDARYLWQGARNFVSLDPQRVPAHVLRLRRARAPRARLRLLPVTAALREARPDPTTLGRAAEPATADDPLWYKDAVIYELHVKAFCRLPTATASATSAA